MTRSIIVVAAMALSACAVSTPPYSPSIQNMQKFENAGAMKLGTFALANPELNKVGLRASSLQSSVGKTFADYLHDSTKQELELAHRLSDDAAVELSAELLENTVDASGFSVGTARLRARFMLRKGAEATYSKEISAENEWPSSFAGAIAIPEAANNYPITVQKLLGNLASDNDFINATR
ncbi:hypothetical protein [Jeongeupia chitinilytica]|uniref:Uncharacterized protein n=1 Tax=Jeongeupia chitinilytica TaxID=1041641 RepID=A0ABQ3GXZ7_9NEIS|nr:hypothetical protein [Jeongeupia chitinilytica]GHD56811.1 hypothetical protein GCM10007350_04560 [Jeongeupia chitinilytica]